MTTIVQAVLLSCCLAAALVLTHVPGAQAYRHLLQPEKDAEGFFVNGRATWFEHPHTGSCGYGKLEGYGSFGRDAVSAMPDIAADYAGSCGRCYEVKYRGIQARSADGAVDLDRSDACYDTTTRVVVKIVDTCPCKGNEKWCCGDAGLVHFDLSDGAFSRLAPQGKGIIGLAWRPVPCEAAATNGTSGGEGPGDWEALQQAIAAGASRKIFVGGTIGQGWKKTIYGDDARAMYTYDNGLAFNGSAVCTTIGQYGGMDFNTDNRDSTVFSGAEGVEFWVPSEGGIPDVVFRIGDIMRGGCAKQHNLAAYATQDFKDGWQRIYFPIADFECNAGISLSDVNRVQWENRNPSKQTLCVKDLQVLPLTTQPVASAGRR